jgi:hypothetical protein
VYTTHTKERGEILKKPRERQGNLNLNPSLFNHPHFPYPANQPPPPSSYCLYTQMPLLFFPSDRAATTISIAASTVAGDNNKVSLVAT